ncbi:MAG TPA: hypothetical protein PK760_12055 [Flavobacteriales bacterium]|nr:hypothetical protein [Flavobacteriales bacterium]
MKTVLKIIGVLALLLIGALIYITQALPNIKVNTDLKVEPTPERIARGEYLAHSVCVCMDCHSTRDWNKFSGPLVPGTLGKGGERFDETMNFPGTFFSKNITPFSLKNWSDGEIYRAITSGVSKDGHPFFPVMPYPNYNKLDTEDVYAIIAYLRTLPEQDNVPEPSKPAFPVNIILHTIPEPAAPNRMGACPGWRHGRLAVPFIVPRRSRRQGLRADGACVLAAVLDPLPLALHRAPEGSGNSARQPFRSSP